MSLFSLVGRLAGEDRTAIAFHPGRCLHALDRHANCQACAQVCPAEAIHPGKPPVFDAGKCAHCLACLQTCPTGAFLAEDSSTALLNCVTRSDARMVELLCDHNPNTDRGWLKAGLGFQLHGCLAGLGAGGYLALAALGLEQVVVRLDACKECPWQTLRPSVEAQVSLAQALLGPYQKEHIFQCADMVDAPCEHQIWDVDNPPFSRRDLFTFAIKQGRGAIAGFMEHTEKGDGDKPAPARMRILSALTYLKAPSSVANPQLPNGNFASLAVSEACTACGTCARACPTHAIRFGLDEGAQTFQLNFFPQLCIGCDLCAHVCKPEAVAIDHAPTFHQVFGSADALLLLKGEIAHCKSCQTVYAARPGISLCPVCEFRRQNPFGTMRPQVKITLDKKNGEAQQ